MSSSVIYFVEGDCEKAFVKSMMFIDGNHFKDGKVEVFNFVNERFPKAKARTINSAMTVVIVFDTDVSNIEMLDENIKVLKTVSMLKDDHIILVPSILNFEDELVYSCLKLKTINDMFKAKGVGEFKKKFINHSDLNSKLDDVGFDFSLIWSRNGSYPFDKYKNSSKKIKCYK